MKKLRTSSASHDGSKESEPLGSAATEATNAESRFPVVGIGASAGGLEALEQFFNSVPVPSGIAFVVVQHLDRTHKSSLCELLQHSTAMKVSQVEHLTKVEPDHVYVIPPNSDMSLLHGALHLIKAATAPRGLWLPINSFFRSLAEDQRHRGIGIILSGMGKDGTLGLRAIKEKGGFALVQSPSSAKFDAMPRSVIEAGLADIVAPVHELPARLIQFLQHAPILVSPESADEEDSHEPLSKVIDLLRRQVGHDFSMYKRNTLSRRIERRMGLHQIASINDYVHYLGENSQELTLLFKELMIGVTSFFRDNVAWDELRDEILPSMMKTRPVGHPLRAWVAGCSSGEEAYSMAIVFKEALQHVKHLGEFSLQIFATDLDRDAVNKARQGYFSRANVADVSQERLNNYFLKEEGGYRITNAIRKMIIFAPHNLIADPPFRNLDILSCRNLLIYFTPELQKKVLPLFHYSLRPGGILFLDNASSIAGFTDLFVPLGGKARFFRRQESVQKTHSIVFPASIMASEIDLKRLNNMNAISPHGLQTSAEQWLLQHHSPAAVLVNDLGDILFINGRTGRFLEPAAGKANWNVLVMAREGMRDQLTNGFKRACLQKETVMIRRLKVTENRSRYFVDICIQLINEPEVLRGLLMIVFTEAPGIGPESKSSKAEPENDRVHELEREVHQVHAELQRTCEEHQSSLEELQSLNEELQTVNAELQAKADESSAANNDMRNLLDSTEIATVFLDNSLNVRRFTEQANKVIKLIPSDVGRPITDLVTNLIYPDLEDDVRKVLRTLVSLDKSLVTHDGRNFAMRMMPYRTIDNRIDGVVITFTDLSMARKIEPDPRSQVLVTEKGGTK